MLKDHVHYIFILILQAKNKDVGISCLTSTFTIDRKFVKINIDILSSSVNGFEFHNFCNYASVFMNLTISFGDFKLKLTGD